MEAKNKPKVNTDEKLVITTLIKTLCTCNYTSNDRQILNLAFSL